MKTIPIMILAAATIAGGYNVKHYFDEFEGQTIYELTDNKVKSDARADIYLNLQKVYTGDDYTYALGVLYFCVGNEHLEISEGNSLLLLVDGEKVELTKTPRPDKFAKETLDALISNYRLAEGIAAAIAGETNAHREERKNRVFETSYSYYSVDPLTVQKMIVAKVLKYKLKGEGGKEITGELKKGDIKDLNKFYTECATVTATDATKDQ